MNILKTYPYVSEYDNMTIFAEELAVGKKACVLEEEDKNVYTENNGTIVWMIERYDYNTEEEYEEAIDKTTHIIKCNVTGEFVYDDGYCYVGITYVD